MCKVIDKQSEWVSGGNLCNVNIQSCKATKAHSELRLTYVCTYDVRVYIRMLMLLRRHVKTQFLTVIRFFIRKFVAFCDFRGKDTSMKRVYKELRPPAWFSQRKREREGERRCPRRLRLRRCRS